MAIENFEITIPKISHTKLKVYVDGQCIGNATVEQINQIREDVLNQIAKTKDSSILDRFYFVGHKDSNEEMGEVVTITMDIWGNLSELPWEMAHVRRSMMRLMRIGRVNSEIFYKLEKK